MNRLRTHSEAKIRFLDLEVSSREVIRLEAAETPSEDRPAASATFSRNLKRCLAAGVEVNAGVAQTPRFRGRRALISRLIWRSTFWTR